MTIPVGVLQDMRTKTAHPTLMNALQIISHVKMEALALTRYGLKNMQENKNENREDIAVDSFVCVEKYLFYLFYDFKFKS